MKEVLKIKETFSSLKTNGIDNIQKIIKAMKGPSRKQVIVPMNNNNKKNFMKESSSHITNMNITLKNIKLEVIVDFV